MADLTFKITDQRIEAIRERAEQSYLWHEDEGKVPTRIADALWAAVRDRETLLALDAARSQPEASCHMADHVALVEYAARSQPEAGLPYDRWIDSLHEDANGLVWTTKAELRAALATPAAGLDDQPVWYQRGWDEGYAAARSQPEAGPDHALHYDPDCEECVYLARPVVIRSQPEAGLREALVALINDEADIRLSDGRLAIERERAVALIRHGAVTPALWPATPAAGLDEEKNPTRLLRYLWSEAIIEGEFDGIGHVRDLFKPTDPLYEDIEDAIARLAKEPTDQ